MVKSLHKNIWGGGVHIGILFISCEKVNVCHKSRGKFFKWIFSPSDTDLMTKI